MTESKKDERPVLLETRFDPRVHDDLFALSSRAQRLTRALHGRSDVVVALRSDVFVDLDHPDETSATHLAPGHYESGQGVLTVNLDDVCAFDHPDYPEPFPRLVDFNSPDRLYDAHPVMMGVMAHELAHARWSLNKPVVPGFAFLSPSDKYRPENLPAVYRRVLEVICERNPDSKVRPADLDDPTRVNAALSAASGIVSLFDDLEEPRIERLIQDGGPGMVFTRHWRDAVRASAGKLIVDGFAVLADRENQTSVTSAVSAMAIVYGRTLSGVLDVSDDVVERIVANCAAVLDTHKPVADDDELTSEIVMRIIRRAVFCDEHDNPTPLIECALDLLDAVRLDPPPAGGDDSQPDDADADADAEPESGDAESGDADDADAGDADAEPESADADAESGDDGKSDAPSDAGDADGDPESGDESPDAASSENGDGFLETLAEDAQELSAEIASKIAETRRSGGEHVDSRGSSDESGHGSVLFSNPQAPTKYEDEAPTADDGALYRSARSWLERTMSPTVSEHARPGWLPMADAEFDVDQYVYDELAGNIGDERGEWRRRDWQVKPAPPVKIGIMLDCSGSMSMHARAAAAAAWALQSAASDIPGSEVCSVAYGNEAGLTLAPGRVPPRALAVMNTNHGTENWIAASALLEHQLRLDDAIADDAADPSGESRTNALIIVVSDLMYGDSAQGQGVVADLARWRDAGFRVVLVGPQSPGGARSTFDDSYVPDRKSESYWKGMLEIGDSELVARALDGVEWVEGVKSADMAREFDRL